MRRVILALVGVAAFFCGREALAQWPYYGGFGGFGNGWFGPPVMIEDRTLPYYSLYPPVYYSAPVPRTYGYSPFAYPPGTMTPELAPAPATIINPHVTPAEPTSSRDRTTRMPRIIRNPFVEVNIAAKP